MRIRSHAYALTTFIAPSPHLLTETMCYTPSGPLSGRGPSLLGCCWMLSLPVLVAALHQSEPRPPERTLESQPVALTIESDASTGQEQQQGVQFMQIAAHNDNGAIPVEAYRPFIKPDIQRLPGRADTLEETKAGSQSVNKGKAGTTSGTTVWVALLVIIVVAALFLIAATYLPGTFFSKSEVKNGSGSKLDLESSRHAASGSRTPLPSRSELTSRDHLPSMESLLRSPFGTGQLLPVDMSLRLPTALQVHSNEGEVFKIVGNLAQGTQGTCRIYIQRTSNNGVVACLHVSEDDIGCGILFELLPHNPIAFLDTQGAMTEVHSQRQVKVFGASAGGWDATAPASAIVKPDSDGFVMQDGSGRELLNFDTGAEKRVTDVKVNGKMVAKIDNDTVGLTLINISGGMDAGLVLMGVVACQKMTKVAK